jgi:hypothetical protein
MRRRAHAKPGRIRLTARRLAKLTGCFGGSLVIAGGRIGCAPDGHLVAVGR